MKNIQVMFLLLCSSVSLLNVLIGRRHKKLGKKAIEHYSRLFARRMLERINMLKDRKEAQTIQQKSWKISVMISDFWKI